MSGELKGTDFVRHILAGERDFAGIRLETGFDIERYDELQKYLLSEHLCLSENPLLLNSAALKGLRARGTHIPFLMAANADFEGACFVNADLRFANLKGANMQGVNFWNALLYGAYLQNANLAGTYLFGTNFSYAQLEDVKGLDNSKCLERAILRKTFVGVQEERIIRAAMRNFPYFVCENKHFYDGLDDEVRMAPSGHDAHSSRRSQKHFVVKEEVFEPVLEQTSELELELVH